MGEHLTTTLTSKTSCSLKAQQIYTSAGTNLDSWVLIKFQSLLHITCTDSYVYFLFLRFQEIVPLSAGNVLVVEDNEPAAKWLALISQALNKPKQDSVYSNAAFSTSKTTTCSSSSSGCCTEESRTPSSLSFFQRPNLKVLSRNYRVDSSLLKTCNCSVVNDTTSVGWEGRRSKRYSDPIADSTNAEAENFRVHENFLFDDVVPAATTMMMPGQMSYRLIASKQMVGLFLSVWARKELIPHISHLRLDSVGRGIMGRLGNKVVT